MWQSLKWIFCKDLLLYQQSGFIYVNFKNNYFSATILSSFALLTIYAGILLLVLIQQVSFFVCSYLSCLLLAVVCWFLQLVMQVCFFFPHEIRLCNTWFWPQFETTVDEAGIISWVKFCLKYGLWKYERTGNALKDLNFLIEYRYSFQNMTVNNTIILTSKRRKGLSFSPIRAAKQFKQFLFSVVWCHLSACFNYS